MKRGAAAQQQVPSREAGQFRARQSAILIALLFLVFAPFVHGQETIQYSAAGERAAADRRLANTLPDYYNLKLGDFQLRLESSLGVEGNDNVRLVRTNQESDIILSPGLNMTASYPLSLENTLNLKVGVGYWYYLEHQDLSRIYITPGTELSFDFYIKDVVLNLHDRIQVINQNYSNPSLGGNGVYSYLENSSGITATWDLNKLQLTLNYDHVVRMSLVTNVQTQDGTEDLVSGSAGLWLNPVMLAGVQIGAGLIQYDTAELNGGVQYNAGVFYKWQVSQFITLSTTLGYYIYQMDPFNQVTLVSTSPPTLKTNRVSRTTDAFYGSVIITHRVNEQLSYHVEGGRQMQTGLFSDTLDLYYARLHADWNLVRKTPIATWVSYENGTETGGAGEDLERYGVGVSVSRAITQKLSSSLSYQHWLRYSSVSAGNYSQNQVLLTLNYRF